MRIEGIKKEKNKIGASGAGILPYHNFIFLGEPACKMMQGQWDHTVRYYGSLLDTIWSGRSTLEKVLLFSLPTLGSIGEGLIVVDGLFS